MGGMQPGLGSEGRSPMKKSSREPNGASTLYVGNLHPCVSQTALQEICTYFGPVEQVKVIKDKNTGQSAGYGFVRFLDRRCANLALQYLQGKVFYGQELRVNWAFQSHQREDTSSHWHVFVGDLGQEVTDAVLFNAFSQLPGCSDARVMWDHATGRSKGYGFVSMRTKEEAQASIEKMHGQVIGSRRVRCGWAQHKQEDALLPMEFDGVDRMDPLNTNVYVGNISPDWAESDIQQHFGMFGPIAEVKLHKKGGYGFIRYEHHKDAVRAIIETHQKVFYGRAVKCSWGRNSSTTGGPGSSSSNMSGMYHGPGGGVAMAPVLMQGVPGVMGHQMQGMMGPQMQGVVMPGMQAGGSMMQAPQLMPAGQVVGSAQGVNTSPVMVLGGQQGPGGLSAGPVGGAGRGQMFHQEGGMFYNPGGLYYGQ